jgi:tetratricopeptide (TPR) repeat protein
MNAKGDYDGVIDYYNRHSETLPPGNVRPKMLLLVGHAYRQRKSYARAVEVYLIIEQYHKDTDESFEAGYWKLYCFYLLGDKELGEFANGFIARYTPIKGDHELLTLARLIRADFFFNKTDFNQAALSYTDLKIEKLPEKLRPGTVFNMGWAQAESGRHQDAVVTFTRFLTDFPGHEFSPKALARRGMANKDARDLPKAKADFELVTKVFPTSDACEIAWLQLGLIGMEMKDAKASIAAFETLLKKFPKTPAAAQAQYGIGRGYFDQKAYDKAIPALRRSFEIDSKTYFDKASQMLMLCEYARQNADELAKTIDGYLAAKPEGVVPANILKWLGLKLYGAEEFKKAARYLELAATPETPENTEPVVWIYLAMSQLPAGNYDQSVAAADNYLKSNPDPSSKARALITKGRAQLGKGTFDAADATAQEALGFVKDGKLQAELLILEGDIYNAHGDDLAKQTQIDAARAKWQAAVGKYAVPSQVFEDDQVTPEALHKAALTFDKLGDTAQAQKLRQQLKQRYPKWQPKV